MHRFLEKLGVKKRFFDEDDLPLENERKNKLPRLLKNHSDRLNGPNLFPPDLKRGDTFPSILEFRRLLIGHPMTHINKDLTQIFTFRKRNNRYVLKGEAVRATCSFPDCPARINVAPTVDNGCVVRTIENLHNHDLNSYVHACPGFRASTIHFGEGFPSVESAGKRTSKPPIKLDDVREFSALYNYLRDKRMLVNVPKEFNPNDIYFPECFVVCTPKMMEFYRRYGDVIYFGFYEGAVRNHTKDGRVHSLVTFTVVDANIRVLFAGFGFTTAYTAQNVKHLIQLFLELEPSKSPECIVLKRSKQTSVATEQMKVQGIFTGSVMYRLDDLLEQLRKGLKGGADAAHLASETFRRLSTTNSPLEFRNCLQILEVDTVNKKVYDDLISCSSNLCLIDMQKRFVGLQENNDALAFQKQIAKQVCGRNYVDVIRKIVYLQGGLERASRQSCLFEDVVQEALGDQKIKAVRRGVMKRVFIRFLENYIESRTKYVASKVEASYRVENRKTSEIFEVFSLKCSCAETEKTGVPCCHLLAAVRSQDSICYLELFNKRWWTTHKEDIKKRQPKSESQSKSESESDNDSDSDEHE